MKTRELERMREFYDEKNEFKAKIKELDSDMKELLDDPKVKEYLRLKEYLESEEVRIWGRMPDCQVRMQAAINAHPTPTNRIFIRVGIFENGVDLKHTGYDYWEFLDKKDPRAGFAYYLNLETDYANTSDTVYVPVSEMDRFEEDNVVIIPKGDPHKDNVFLYYHKLKGMFFDTCLEEDEDAALKKIYDIYRQNAE